MTPQFSSSNKYNSILLHAFISSLFDKKTRMKEMVKRRTSPKMIQKEHKLTYRKGENKE
jgi:hypothetical protein